MQLTAHGALPFLEPVDVGGALLPFLGIALGVPVPFLGTEPGVPVPIALLFFSNQDASSTKGSRASSSCRCAAHIQITERAALQAAMAKIEARFESSTPEAKVGLSGVTGRSQCDFADAPSAL